MEATVIMTAVSAVLAFAYVAWATWRQGCLPDSISALAYPNGKTDKHTTAVWIVWVWAVTSLLVPRLLDVMPETWKFVGFLTAGSLLFVGAMPLVANERNTAHYVLAVIAGVLSQVCVAIISPWWLAVWTLFVGVAVAAYFFPDKTTCFNGKGVMLLEIICWASLTGALLV